MVSNLGSGCGLHYIKGGWPLEALNLHQVTMAYGWCCQDWNPGLLDPSTHPLPAHHLSLYQAGPDFSSDKSLAIPAKKWDSLSALSGTRPPPSWSWPILLFPSQDMQRVLCPSKGGRVKSSFKKSGLVFATSFFPQLVIYHDHLSMPVNIIIHHPKKKSPVSRLSREDKCFPCANSSTVYIIFCNAGKLFPSHLSI